MTEVSRNLGSSGTEAFEGFIRQRQDSGSSGILSCVHRMYELLSHCRLFKTPCGPVSWPPALYKAPWPRLEVCQRCHLAKACKLQSKPVSSCWYLSCCRPQLSSHHISLSCKSSSLFARGLCFSRKGLHYLNNKKK